MALKVFISHSVAPGELGIVYAIANEAAKRGATTFIPDRDWDTKSEIPERIQSQLKETDCILAIATSSGFQLDWLSREITEGAKAHKQLLVVADKGVKISSKLSPIWIDRLNPAKTVGEAAMQLEKFGKDKEAKKLLTWIGIGGLLFLLLLGSEK